MPSSHILQFIGGLTFFFFGLFTINQGLTFFAGDRLKSMIARTTRSRFHSFFTGMIVTFFLQSSSAVTVMTAGLTSSGLLSLEQAMAVSLGAGLGTTFVVFLMSIKEILEWGLLIITVGLILRATANRKIISIFGKIIFGFGFVFFGMSVMAQSTTPLKTYAWIPQILQFMEVYPFANFLIAAVITAVVHSSGVVLGILLALAYSDSITFAAAVPLILGANIGTSFTAILLSINSRTEGRRAAWANLLLRVGAVTIILLILPYYIDFQHAINAFLLETVIGNPASVHWEIALSHFFFNAFVAILFLPFLGWGKKLICWMVPMKPSEKEVFGPRYLDVNALSTPSLAFAQALRELVRMGEIVQGMLRDSLNLFRRYDLDQVDDIKERDHKVDQLYKAIKFYLARFSFKNLKEDETETGMQIMTGINEMESVGDIIDRQLVRLAHKKWKKSAEFSDLGWKEICEMHQGTMEMIEYTLASLASGNQELARKMKRHQAFYAERTEQLKRSHLMRLSEGLKESIETSQIHLELISLFNQINYSLLLSANHLLPEKERTNSQAM